MGVEVRQGRNLLFRRPPTSARATVDARKPAVCFRRSEQASIAVAAVGILAKLTRTIRRHRTGRQRQARCFAQQIGPSRSMHCRRTAHDARCDLDRAEIAGVVRPLRSRNWRGFLLAKQSFEYFDHDGAPVGDLATIHWIRKYVCHLSFNLLFSSRARRILCTTIDRNSATGRPSSQITYEYCDGCLTARRCKLNGWPLGLRSHWRCSTAQTSPGTVTGATTAGRRWRLSGNRATHQFVGSPAQH
jgi:hypothetical protein